MIQRQIDLKFLKILGTRYIIQDRPRVDSCIFIFVIQPVLSVDLRHFHWKWVSYLCQLWVMKMLYCDWSAIGRLMRRISLTRSHHATAVGPIRWVNNQHDSYVKCHSYVERTGLATTGTETCPLPPLLTVPNYKWYCGHATHSLSPSPQSCFAFITTCAHTATCDIPMQDKLF